MITPKQKIYIEKILTNAHDHHEKKMSSYASFKLSSKTKGSDLVQDTFIKTWRYLAKGEKIHLMKPFLYRVLNHLIIDEYRKAKTVSLDAILEKGFDPGVDGSEDTINNIDGKIALLLIKSLPEKYETVMHMKYVKNLSLEEMAVLTGQSKNTVSVQVHRGLKKLRKLYKHK